MEREGSAAMGDTGCSRDASSTIVLPAGSAAVRQQSLQHRSQQREKEQQPATGAEFIQEPPEKVFYKTRLCEKFEVGGRCAYEDGCTFAHGHAELRPPLPLPSAARRSRMAPLPADADNNGRARFPFHSGTVRVCFEFRDRGTCHYGDMCHYAHASAAVQPTDMRYSKVPELVRRSTMSPAIAFSLGSGNIYAPSAARAFPLGADAAEQGGAKPTRLELLSRKKMSGIYGDWPEEF